MLSIKPDSKHVSRWRDWHIGDPIPEGIPQVAVIQLDGHELLMLLEAMRTARVVSGGRVEVGPDALNRYENYYGPGRPID